MCICMYKVSIREGALQTKILEMGLFKAPIEKGLHKDLYRRGL